MSEKPQAAESGTDEEESTENIEALTTNINRAQGLVRSLKQKLTPYLTREAENLETDLEVIERWAVNAEHDSVEALAGAPAVVETAQVRIHRLQDEIGQSDQGLVKRLENLEDAVEEIEDIVDSLSITTTAYVTYVNRAFADRYFDAQVTIRSILVAGLEDSIEDIEDQVDEFGLFPQDGLFGQNVEDLAFPANREVNLDEEHRIYWTSTSDGGKIA